jgi:hypothetical protein
MSQRRVVYRLHGLKSEEAREWLQLAKACREAQNFSVATDAVLHARSLGAKTAVIAHAKLLYSDNQVHVVRHAVSSGLVWSMGCCVVLCCVVLCCVARCVVLRVVLCCALCCVVLCCVVLRVVLCCVVLSCALLDWVSVGDLAQIQRSLKMVDVDESSVAAIMRKPMTKEDRRLLADRCAHLLPRPLIRVLNVCRVSVVVL